jgi:membrane protein
MFPFFIFLTALGALGVAVFGGPNPTSGLIQQLRENLPPGVSDVLTTELQRLVDTRSAGLLSFGIVGALWATMGGIKSVMRAMNRAYDVPESRPFLRQNIVAFFLAVVFGIFVLVASLVLVGGELFAQQIATWLGLPQVVVGAVRWALAIALILLATAFVYWSAPNVKLPFRLVTPGSLVFALGWLGGTLGFAFYVENFGTYSVTYGTLGGFVVLLVWFYLSSYVLLLGAEVDAVLARSRAATDSKRQSQVSESGSPHAEARPSAVGRVLGVLALLLAALLIRRAPTGDG